MAARAAAATLWATSHPPTESSMRTAVLVSITIVLVGAFLTLGAAIALTPTVIALGVLLIAVVAALSIALSSPAASAAAAS
jgi:hypothetical protein